MKGCHANPDCNKKGRLNIFPITLCVKQMVDVNPKEKCMFDIGTSFVFGEPLCNKNTKNCTHSPIAHSAHALLSGFSLWEKPFHFEGPYLHFVTQRRLMECRHTKKQDSCTLFQPMPKRQLPTGIATQCFPVRDDGRHRAMNVPYPVSKEHSWQHFGTNQKMGNEMRNQLT